MSTKTGVACSIEISKLFEFMVRKGQMREEFNLAEFILDVGHLASNNWDVLETLKDEGLYSQSQLARQFNSAFVLQCIPEIDRSVIESDMLYRFDPRLDSIKDSSVVGPAYCER